MTAVTIVEVFVENEAIYFSQCASVMLLNRLQFAKFSTGLCQLHQQSALTLRSGQLTFACVDG